MKCYNHIVLAYGVNNDKKMGIPGEHFENVFSARDFVGWYNGDPDCSNLNVKLGKTAVIIGVGNVALDCARILLSGYDKLKDTDITDPSLSVLEDRKVRDVHIIARRGPEHTSFTTKELRELINLPVNLSVLNTEEFKLHELDIERSKMRLLKLLFEKRERIYGPNVYLHYNKVPRAILKRPDLQVSFVDLDVIHTDIVIRAIGYSASSIDPSLELKNHCIPNVGGQVNAKIYVSGWIKRGPVGVLATTMMDAFDTAENLASNIDNSPVESAIDLLKGVNYTTWEDWLVLDKYETTVKPRPNQSREKVTSVKGMLKIMRD
jgi:adrenodoxin-NADP+ reductase